MKEYQKAKCPNKLCSTYGKKTVQVELDENDPGNDRQYFDVRDHRCPTCRVPSPSGWKKVMTS